MKAEHLMMELAFLVLKTSRIRIRDYPFSMNVTSKKDTSSGEDLISDNPLTFIQAFNRQL